MRNHRCDKLWKINLISILGTPSTDQISDRLSSGWTRRPCCSGGTSSAISSSRDAYSASVNGSDGSETAFSILQQSDRASRSFWISKRTPSSNFRILSSIDSRDEGIFRSNARNASSLFVWGFDSAEKTNCNHDFTEIVYLETKLRNKVILKTRLLRWKHKSTGKHRCHLENLTLK